MWESFWVYLSAIGYEWFVGLFAVEGAIAMAERFLKKDLPWKWFMGMALVLFLAVAPFLAFHHQRLRVERLELRLAHSEAVYSCRNASRDLSEFSKTNGVNAARERGIQFDETLQQQYTDGLHAEVARACTTLADYQIETNKDGVTPCQNITSITQLGRLNKYLKTACLELEEKYPRLKTELLK